MAEPGPEPPAPGPESQEHTGWSGQFWEEIKAAFQVTAALRGSEPADIALRFLEHFVILHREGAELFADWVEGWTERQRLGWCWAGAIARTELDFPALPAAGAEDNPPT